MATLSPALIKSLKKAATQSNFRMEIDGKSELVKTLCLQAHDLGVLGIDSASQDPESIEQSLKAMLGDVPFALDYGERTIFVHIDENRLQLAAKEKPSTQKGI